MEIYPQVAQHRGPKVLWFSARDLLQQWEIPLCIACAFLPPSGWTLQGCACMCWGEETTSRPVSLLA